MNRLKDLTKLYTIQSINKIISECKTSLVTFSCKEVEAGSECAFVHMSIYIITVNQVVWKQCRLHIFEKAALCLTHPQKDCTVKKW